MVGDLLDKPVPDGGLALGRYVASAVLLTFMVVALIAFPQKAGRHPAASGQLRPQPPR